MLKEWNSETFAHMLEEMMALQKNFGKKFIAFGSLSVEDQEKWTKELTQCCASELQEILGCVNWKHWKQKQYPIDELSLKYELVDLWHFVMSLMLVWGMTPLDLFSMYITKNRENHDRQKRGY
jgi:dimeric dUTPase (all-alpha-NTP-PPase superfamily)